MSKQIIIDYEEYLKLQKCYDIVNKERYNNAHNIDFKDNKKKLYIQDSELMSLLNDGRYETPDEIIITKEY